MKASRQGRSDNHGIGSILRIDKVLPDYVTGNITKRGVPGIEITSKYKVIIMMEYLQFFL